MRPGFLFFMQLRFCSYYVREEKAASGLMRRKFQGRVVRKSERMILSPHCFSRLSRSRLPYVRKTKDIVRIVLLLQVGRLSHRGTCCPHNAIPTAGKGQRDRQRAVRKRKSVAETENSMRSAESESMAGYDITSFVEFGSASVFRKRIRFLCVDDLPALQIGAEKETSVNRSPKPKKTPEPVRVRG